MEKLYQREISHFVDLQRWLHHTLLEEPGVVFPFTGSYTSVVSYALLKSAYKGKVDLVFIKVLSEPWKEELCRLWVNKLGVKCRTLDLTPIATCLEDQVEDIFELKSTYTPDVVKLGLKCLAEATRRPIIWSGDRNVEVLSGPPNLGVRTIAPLSGMTHAQVRRLGVVLEVDDSWLSQEQALPPGLYPQVAEAYREFDYLVGVWQSHYNDFQDTGQSPLDIRTFDWTSTALEDEHDKVVLSEIAERHAGVHAENLKVYRDLRSCRWGGPFDVGHSSSEKFETLGSIFCSVVGEGKVPSLQIRATTNEGRDITFTVHGSGENVRSLLARLDQPAPKYSLRSREGEVERIIQLELTEESREDLRTSLGEISS